MVEPLRSTAYLGPDKGRWSPATWADVVEAAAGGLIDETQWVDLKQELPVGKATVNTDVAKDLASLAVDGGLLIIGVEDHHSHAGKVCGVELAKLADRVDQIARDKVLPSLVVRSLEVPDPDRPGHGCLLVHVPPSAQAPHMVDYVYYGRGDRANIKLSDEQVRGILADRARTRSDIAADLRQMVHDDPLPDDERQHSHLYLLAQPEVAPEEVFVGLLARNNAVTIINELLDEIARTSNWPSFDPRLQQLPWRSPRAEGHAFTTVSGGDRIYEPGMLDLLVREDGGIRLICGRGTDFGPGPRFADTPPPRALIAVVALGLTQAFAALAGRLADQYAAYQGQWRLGIRIDRLRGVVPMDKLASPGNPPGHPYTRDEYERVTSASTEELVNAPHAITERLLAPLLRGLGIAPQYLPLNPGQAGS
ncbi:helix-turn-helix domain-containing protein [Actinophytocola sp.]|uniref:AlbA family DNA-binding domain-containing protein n=1 Tax=Actinophytocola sp. TaxID=1872138 RepID=UPI0025BC46F8|nr:ATP-binding protein [Actinophytocola sp.]